MTDTITSQPLSRASRRGFLKSAAATARRSHDRLSLVGPVEQGAGGDAERIRAERLLAHRARQQRHGDRQASRNGPGQLHRPCHRGRRRARCRLGPDPGRIRAGGRKRYANLWFGTIQGTGGSSAMANSWMQLRKAGATARAMLIAAAAAEWHVAPASLVVERGVVSHPPSHRTATFGELAAKASDQPVPADAPLKDPKDFRLIGQKVPRVDVPGRLTAPRNSLST